MKSSAILPVLLILFVCSVGCDRNDLPEDPWLDVYGTYTGISEIYMPGNTRVPGDSLRNWQLLERISSDTIHLTRRECTGSLSGSAGCLRALWEGACSNGMGCVFNLNMLNSPGAESAFKSNRTILTIPRGMIYPGSEFTLSVEAGKNITGIEWSRCGGLYIFHLETDPTGSAYLLQFTGRKQPDGSGAAAWYGGGHLYYSEKHYEHHATP